MICPKCGAYIAENGRFVNCPKCGAMFDTLDVPANYKINHGRNPSSSYKAPNKTPKGNYHSPQNTQAKTISNINTKSTFGKVIAILAVVSLLFVLIIFFADSCNNRSGNDSLNYTQNAFDIDDDSNQGSDYSYNDENSYEESKKTTTIASSTKITESKKKERKQANNTERYEPENYYNGNRTVSSYSGNNYQETNGNASPNSEVNDWLKKDYYWKATISDAVFGNRYDRAPLTKKPYSIYATIPDSDYICSIYPGDHFYALGESQSGAEKVYYNGYVGYVCDVYTLDATYYDKSFSFNAPGVYIVKSNGEYIAYKNGPIPNYSGIAPAKDSYWLISRGKVYFDLSADILVYYKENGKETPVYLQIDRGEMVAIKTQNGIVLWSA